MRKIGDVLILILVEDSRRPSRTRVTRARVMRVLILILVEDSRRQDAEEFREFNNLGLNPYSSGR